MLSQVATFRLTVIQGINVTMHMLHKNKNNSITNIHKLLSFYYCSIKLKQCRLYDVAPIIRVLHLIVSLAVSRFVSIGKI